MPATVIHDPAFTHVWQTRYRWNQPGHVPEPSIEATWERVALAISAAERLHRDDWRERFHGILRGLHFLPCGRVLAGAGTTLRNTLCNGFVSGSIEDSVPGIFEALRETMSTQQAGGGISLDFSTLRPAGSPAVASGGVASGPVSFLPVWEAATRALETGNNRAGALMVTLRCDHPDIEAFIGVGSAGGVALPHGARAIAITDAFMHALETDGPWPLVFPLGLHPVPAGAEVCERSWPGSDGAQPCLVYRRIPARLLWERIVAATHAGGEPGLLFVDRINRANNLWYSEQIGTTNPGAEVPLPPHGACNQGSINLPCFVQDPFCAHAQLDFVRLRAAAGIATRFLDDVLDCTVFPLKAQEKMARAKRRIGLGATGLADMFAMLGLRYGAPGSIDLAHEIMIALRDTAYRTSIDVAREKGPFPAFDKTRYGASPFVLELPHDIQDGIATHGIRNSHLLSVAPADMTSLLANNVSSGIEPIQAFAGKRPVRGADGQPVMFDTVNAAVREFRRLHGGNAPLPPHWVQTADVTAEDQLHMMAAVQCNVDNAVAGTVRLPHDAGTQAFELALLQAWESGLKTCRACRMPAP